MAKFKVGDKVVIRDGSGIKWFYGYWVNNMSEYIGETATIKEVKTDTKDKRIGYRFKEF